MKELERTKRISISAVLFLLVVIIAVLTFKKPAYVFEKNTLVTLDKIVAADYMLFQKDLKSINASDYVLIDVRSNYEYANGHFEGAINIAAHNILENETRAFLTEISNKKKTIVLYGDHPHMASSVWMLLYQLGYENVKVLCVETSLVDNKFQAIDVNIEKPSVNYAEVMKKSMGAKSGETTAKKTKKVITVKKKKKRVAEGGC